MRTSYPAGRSASPLRGNPLEGETVCFVAAARADLDGIWEYIAERSSAETATEFVWKFYEMFASIASSPAAGVAVPDLREGARKFPMGNYLIYYWPKRGRVEIVRVLHGKRVQKRALRERQ